MNDDFEKMMKHVLRIAEREGVRPPVIALLKHDSMHASSIVKKMTGHSINSPEVQGDPEYGVTAAWSVTVACQLLRRHCVIGGQATANLLEGRHAVDYWLLMVGNESLSVFGCRTGRKSIHSSVYFDKLFGVICDCCLNRRGPAFLKASLKGGDSVIVQGKNSIEAVYAASLVTLASKRSLPPLKPKNGERGLPIKDSDLVVILREHFAEQPRSVSEALRALRKADRPAFRWLTEVLKSSPTT